MISKMDVERCKELLLSGKCEYFKRWIKENELPDEVKLAYILDKKGVDIGMVYEELIIKKR
jgi:hypothetical protein